MRYWGYFTAKLAVSGMCMYGLWWALNRYWPRPPSFYYFQPPLFGYDLWYTLMVGLLFLFGCGLVYLSVWDQRYRCRVCIRRLRMPVGTGSWSRMLQLGRPRIEYICLYGHGSLAKAEVQISGLENPEWTPRGEMWDELFAVGDGEDRR
jgi:hypothetical protein